MPDPRPDETEAEFVERCIPITISDGTAKDGTEANAICHSMFEQAQEKKMLNGRGLYLADPHGKLIWQGKKSFIAKAKEVDIEGEWHIISKDKAYGKAILGECQPVESSEFDELFDVHRITHKERSKWWGEKAPLYLYEIKSFEKYDPPLEVVVPDGVQFVIESVEFKDPFPDEDASSGYVADNDKERTKADLSGSEDQSSTETEVEVEEKRVMKPEGDGKHPSSHYLVVEDPEKVTTWHLRVRDAAGEIDRGLMGAAWAALHGGYRGNVYEGPGKQEAISKLRAIYKREGVDLPGEKAGRRIRTSKVNVLKDLKKKFEEIMKEIGELIGFADYADKQPFYNLLHKESGFKTFKNKKDGKTWILTWTTNSFIDREDEIFSQKSIEDYVERHFEDDIKGEFQFWHMPGSKFGDILGQGVSGRFLVETGPFDDTPIGRAFEKAFTEYPDGHPIVAPEGWGTSHKYYFKLEDREDGVYNWFDKEETTVLPMSAASNPHSPKLEVLKVEQKQIDALTDLGIDDELVKAIIETGDEETKTLESAGVARKEKESEEKEVVAEAEGEVEVGDETVEIEAEIEAEAPAEEIEVEGEKEEVDEPVYATLEEVKAGFGALGGFLKELMGDVASIKTSMKSLERDDESKLKEIIELTPKDSMKAFVAESVIGKDETKVDGREKLAKSGPEETKEKEELITGVPILDNIKKRNIDHGKVRPS